MGKGLLRHWPAGTIIHVRQEWDRPLTDVNREGIDNMAHPLDLRVYKIKV